MGMAGSPEPGKEKYAHFRGIYIRPILLVYSFLGTFGTLYTCFTEKHIIMRVNNCATLLLHSVIFVGVVYNTELSLRFCKKYMKIFVVLYSIAFISMPVVVASYRASGSMTPEPHQVLFESVECMFKKEGHEIDQPEFDRQLDIHTKDQIFKVFTDVAIKKKVNKMFEQKEERKYILMMVENEGFKDMIKHKFTAEGFFSDMIFDRLLQDIKNRHMFKSGMLSGFGMELACILTLALVYMEYALVKRLWIHSISSMPTESHWLYF